MRKSGGSKLGSSILAFFLGFLFAFILEFGLIAGAVYYVITMPINDVLSFAGLTNDRKDEDGNVTMENVYINKEKIPNLLEGVKYMAELASNFSDLTIEKASDAFPVIKNYFYGTQDDGSDGLFNIINTYVDISYQDFSAQKITELPNYLKDLAMNANVVDLLMNLDSTFSFGVTDLLQQNSLVRSALLGAECSYISLEDLDEMKHIVYYTDYTYSNGHYYLDGQQVDNVSVYEEYMQSTTRDGQTKRLYYFFVKEGMSMNTTSYPYLTDEKYNVGSTTIFKYFVCQPTQKGYAPVSFDQYTDPNDFTCLPLCPFDGNLVQEAKMPTGDWHDVTATGIGNAGDLYYYYTTHNLDYFIQTLTGSGEDSNGGLLSLIGSATVLDILQMVGMGEDQMLSAIFNGVTISDFTQENGFTNVLNGIKISDLMGGEGGDNLIANILGDATIGSIMEDPMALLDGLYLGDILEVGVDDGLMVGLAYGYYEEEGKYYVDVEKEGQTEPTKQEVTIEYADAEKTKIKKVYYMDGDTEVKVGFNLGSLLNGGGFDVMGVLGGVKLSALLSDPTLLDMLDPDRTKTIGDLLDNPMGLMSSVTLGGFLNPKKDDGLMIALCYGYYAETENDVTKYYVDITENEVTTKQEVTVVVNEQNVVTEVYYYANNEKVNVGLSIQDLMDGKLDLMGIMNTLKLSDLGLSGSMLDMLGKDATIGDLMGGDFLDTVYLGSILKPSKTDAVQISLCYGYYEETVEGVTKYYVGEGNDKKEVVLHFDEETGTKVISVTCLDDDTSVGTTLGSMMNGLDIQSLFGTLKVTEMMHSDGNDMISQIFGNASVGDLMSGNFNVESAVKDMRINALLTDIAPTDNLMVYLAYGKTLESDGNGGYRVKGDTANQYTVTLQGEGNNKTIKSIVDNTTQSEVGTTVTGISSIITNMMSELTLGDVLGDSVSGSTIMQKLSGYKIDKMSDAINELALSDFMTDIAPTDNLMVYLTYGKTLESDGNGGYRVKGDTANQYTVTLQGEGNNKTIKSIVDNTTQKEIGTTVMGVNSIITNMMSELTLGDVLGDSVGSSPIMQKLAKYHVDQISTAIDDLVLPDVLTNISTDDKLMMYVAYGVYTNANGVRSVKVGGTEYPVTIAEGKVTYYNGTQNVALEGTKVNEISSVMGGITEALTLGDIVNPQDTTSIIYKLRNYTVANMQTGIMKLELGDVLTMDEQTPKLLKNFEHTTIENLSSEFGNLTLLDVMDAPANSNLMVYLVYGVTLEQTGDSYVVKGDTASDYAVTVENGNVTKITYQGSPITATKIDQISTKINSLTSDLTLGDMMEIGVGDGILYSLRNKKIGEMSSAIQDLGLYEVISVTPADSSMMLYLTFGVTKKGEDYFCGSDQVTPVLSSDNTKIVGFKKQDNTLVTATPISGVSDKISNMTSHLALGDMIPNLEQGSILYRLKDSPIDQIGTAMEALTMQELYTSAIYGNEVLLDVVATQAEVDSTHVLFNPNYIYYDQNGKILGTDGKLTAYQANIKTYGQAKGLWGMMVSDENGNESLVKLQQMDTLTTNVTSNMQTATLYKLKDAGLVSCSQEQLETIIKKSFTDPGKPLGEFTLTEMIDAFIAMGSMF